MSVNKNFVVKNGLEVKSNLLLADVIKNSVGIGTSVINYKLHVLGGIGATTIYVSSGSTIADLSGSTITYNTGTFNTGFVTTLNASKGNIVTGVVTSISGSTLNYTGISTVGSLYINSTQVISNSRELQNIASLDATTTATIEAAIANAPNTFTNLIVTGVSTLGVTSATQLTAQNLNVTGVGTITNLNGIGLSYTNLSVTGVATIGTLNASNVTISGAAATNFTVYNNFYVGGIGTIATGIITNLSGTNLNYSGIGTIGTIRINSGIITATSGIITYYGDGSKLTNILSGVGIRTSGGLVGTGATILDFRGAGISTVTVSSGIATINITGGTGGATIGIGSTPGDAFVGIITAGNLWYNSDLGRLFIYYQDTNSAQWVDAAPFNQGGLFVSKYGDNVYAGLGVTVGSLSSPSIYFNGYTNSGFYSPAPNQFGVVVSGSQILNINAGGVRVTGVATAQDFDSLSDINYKENVTTVNNALMKVEQLRGVKFDWKDSGLPSYGVIAQELEEVLPELVHGNEPKTVNYNGIIGVLIEAIKELKAEVEDLKDQLNK